MSQVPITEPSSQPLPAFIPETIEDRMEMLMSNSVDIPGNQNFQVQFPIRRTSSSIEPNKLSNPWAPVITYGELSQNTKNNQTKQSLPGRSSSGLLSIPSPFSDHSNEISNHIISAVMEPSYAGNENQSKKKTL